MNEEVRKMLVGKGIDPDNEVCYVINMYNNEIVAVSKNEENMKRICDVLNNPTEGEMNTYGFSVGDDGKIHKYRYGKNRTEDKVEYVHSTFDSSKMVLVDQGNPFYVYDDEGKLSIKTEVSSRDLWKPILKFGNKKPGGWSVGTYLKFDTLANKGEDDIKILYNPENFEGKPPKSEAKKPKKKKESSEEIEDYSEEDVMSYEDYANSMSAPEDSKDSELVRILYGDIN